MIYRLRSRPPAAGLIETVFGRQIQRKNILLWSRILPERAIILVPRTGRPFSRFFLDLLYTVPDNHRWRRDPGPIQRPRPERGDCRWQAGTEPEPRVSSR